MLTQTLRALERDGLVSRTVTAGVPVRVAYQLTPLGESLMPAVNAVKSWAEGHIGEIEASRPPTAVGRPRAKLGSRPFSPELLLNRPEKVLTPNE